MVVEDERDKGMHDGHTHLFRPANQPGGIAEIIVSRPPAERDPVTIAGVIAVTNRLNDSRLCLRLRDDIIEHLWMLHGDA